MASRMSYQNRENGGPPCSRIGKRAKKVIDLLERGLGHPHKVADREDGKSIRD
jgi:hypothetical protein